VNKGVPGGAWTREAVTVTSTWAWLTCSSIGPGAISTFITGNGVPAIATAEVTIAERIAANRSIFTHPQGY
jgi:hypothetical protein